MTENILTQDIAADEIPPRKSQIGEIWHRFKKNKLGVYGLIVICVLIALCVCAPLVASYEECITMDVRNKLLKPSLDHFFGTDGYGRDLFARCLHGGRVSLLIGLSTSLLSLLAGGLLGLLAGFYGGKVDEILMRALDILNAIPTILLALAIVAAMGSTIPNMIIALAISRLPGFARLTRASVLSEADKEYVEAAKAGGTSDFRIMVRHILPNIAGPMIVQTTMNVAAMILQAASMSFLGLGVTAPQPEWGALISEAKEFMRSAPHLITFPGLLIILSASAVSLLGDGLRDALDPRLK